MTLHVLSIAACGPIGRAMETREAVPAESDAEGKVYGASGALVAYGSESCIITGTAPGRSSITNRSS